MKLLLDASYEELTDLIELWGEPRYRIDQIWHGIYKNNWNSPDRFVQLPKGFRTRLAGVYAFSAIEPVLTQYSSDKNTVKTQFRLFDGEAIEAVLMHYYNRNTVCISTQVGCAMGCVFCATGRMGLLRNLTAGEIIAQVLFYANLLRERDLSITNVVIMGMGEPFHNYDSTMQAIDRLNAKQGISIGERRFTISTVGLIPAIIRFTSEKRQVNLAVSLHAADDALRASLLPIAKKYPLADLLSTCQEYIATTGRRISFEWALVNGINDSKDQAILLAEKLKGMLCHVNIIQLNPIPAYQGQAATREHAMKFRETLTLKNIPCTLRVRRGIDIQAGCGQLISKIEENKL